MCHLVSPPRPVGCGLGVDVDGGLVGGEEEFVVGGEDPAAFDAGGDGLVTFAVRQDQHAVPAATVLGIVEDAGGGVEVGASATDALGFDLGALAPLEGVLEVGGGVEGDHGDGDLLGEGGEFAKEDSELGVVDGAGLVDGDEELGDVAALGAGVDVGEALVDALDGVGSLTAGEVADELAEDVAPVDRGGHRGADLFAKLGGNVAPAVGLCVCRLDGAVDDGLDLALDQLLHLLGKVVPGGVVVEGIEVAEGGVGVVALLLLLLRLLLELLVVPLGSLVAGHLTDQLRDGHRRLLLVGELAAIGGLREDTGEEAALREGDAIVAGCVVGDEGVDGEVGGHVPHLRGRLAPRGEVVEDEVVELVAEEAADLGVGHRLEEVRVPVQSDVVELRVVGDGGGGDVRGGRLPDVAAQLREERVVLEELDDVAVEIVVGLDGVHGYSISFRWEVFTPR